MRVALLAFPFVLLAVSSATAQEMPNSLNMTCAATSALVKERGQVVIGSGPNIFQRVISEPGACFAEQEAVPAWLPTSDQSQCLVGYRCQERISNQK